MAYLRKVGKAYGRGALRSCIVSIVGLVFGVAMLSTVLWVAGGRNMTTDNYRPLLALMVPMVFMAVLGLLLALFVVVRNRRLDRAFGGLEVESHQVSAVQRGWHGEFRGRTLDAWFRKGPTLELYLGCETATRGGIARSGEFSQRLGRALTNREPLTPTPSQVAACTVYADDPEWMRRLLGAPGVARVLERLLAETERVSPMLTVVPNAVHYMRRFGPVAELDQENLQSWLDDLARVAGAVDSIGPSASADRPGRLDEWARTRRGRRYLPAFYGCLGLLMLAGFALVMLIFYLGHY